MTTRIRNFNPDPAYLHFFYLEWQKVQNFFIYLNFGLFICFKLVGCWCVYPDETLQRNQTLRKAPSEKSIFKLHGNLLTAYLIVFALAEIIFIQSNGSENNKNLNNTYIFYGIYFILAVFANLLEMTTLYLVVKLILMIRPLEKETRSNFKRFLFKELAENNELRATILANNPAMNQSQR